MEARGAGGWVLIRRWGPRKGVALSDLRASCFLAHGLAARLPDDVHVEPQRTFHAFEPTPVGVARLVERNEADLDGVVSLHLAAHLWWEQARRDFSAVHAGIIDEDWVRDADVTYAVAARRFLPMHAGG
jgi:hypothetical protein